MSKKGLEEKRADLKAQMEELLNTSKAEERAMNEEEVSKFDELEKSIKEIDATIEREEKINNMEEKEIKVEEVVEATQEERDIKSFAEYIRCQASGMEVRADVNMTKSDNGAVIPSTILNKIIEKVNELSPIYARASKYAVNGTLNIPTEDTSVNSITVAFADEFSDLESTTNKFATISLTGYLYGALTKVSKSLLRNSDFNLTNWIINKLAKKVAAFAEGQLINGTNNKVSGIARSYDATNMKVVLTNKTKVVAEDLINIQDTLKDAYQENACWIMSRATRTNIRKLKDADGEYLLNKDFRNGFGYELLGKPVFVSENAPALGTTGNLAIIYGDLSGLAVKEGEKFEVQVLNEKYATQHAIGVVGWGEIDAKVENTDMIVCGACASADAV